MMMPLTCSLMLASAHKTITVIVVSAIALGLRFLLKAAFPHMSQRRRSTIVTVVGLVLIVVAVFAFPSNW